MNDGAKSRPEPPGQVKIENALRALLEEKDFNSITTAEIARTSGVNEALIYRYFKDKRGLLHQVLNRDLEAFVERIRCDIAGIEGALNKLRRLIHGHIGYYRDNRIFAKMLLLEVRNHPGYFDSDTYRLVREYGRMILEIIETGQAEGVIRRDLPAWQIRQAVLGGIEHLCLPAVIFGKPIPAGEYAENFFGMLFDGIRKIAGPA